MKEERCPLCLRFQPFDLENQKYYKLQNTERLVCRDCGREIDHHMRPTWQVIAGRVFPKSTLQQ